jgi:hypothetical protein
MCPVFEYGVGGEQFDGRRSERLYNIVKGGKMGRACSMYGERRGAYMVIVGKSEGRRPLRGRPRRR